MDELLNKTKEICRLFSINPSRRKGQNFLIREDVYETIVEAAALHPTDLVLEVGPGLGFLTSRLASQAGRVIAVELDEKLADYLKVGFSGRGDKKVEIKRSDILRFWSDDLIEGKYKIVANLPYNITSFFLRRFLSSLPRPELMVLMLQKEVAERIVARPPEMSLLALSVQYYAEAEIIRTVKASAFWPSPQVDSAVIRIRTKREKVLPDEEKAFFRLARTGFSAKRKMLKNNLAAGLKIKPGEAEKILVEKGLDPKIRAEDLSLEDWQKLLGGFRPFMV